VAGFSINTVVVSGNLTRDPELRSLPSGTTVCELGIAVNERNKNPQTNEWEDRPNYFDVTVWGGMGEWAARSLQKGAGLTVEGRLRWEQWESNGEKRSKVKIVANSLVPRDDRAGGGGGMGGGGGEYRAQRSDVPVNTDDFATAPVGGGSSSAPADDDIPF
jgi:single-strand DNA-binding protein